MINKDGSSRQRYWYPEYTNGEEARLYRWKWQVTREGYTCTFTFGDISKEQSAQLQRIDLTWRESRDKELLHNYYDVENSYSPSFRIIGIERAEVINYVKEFEVELRLPKTVGSVSIDAGLKDKDLKINCQNPIDTQKGSTAAEAKIARDREAKDTSDQLAALNKNLKDLEALAKRLLGRRSHADAFLETLEKTLTFTRAMYEKYLIGPFLVS